MLFYIDTEAGIAFDPTDVRIVSAENQADCFIELRYSPLRLHVKQATARRFLDFVQQRGRQMTLAANGDVIPRDNARSDHSPTPSTQSSCLVELYEDPPLPPTSPESDALSAGQIAGLSSPPTN